MKQPGITRDERISDAGLRRLEAQLARGGQLSDVVLAQWIRRYGDAARGIIRKAGRYHKGLEEQATTGFPPARE